MTEIMTAFKTDSQKTWVPRERKFRQSRPLQNIRLEARQMIGLTGFAATGPCGVRATMAMVAASQTA
jgi:hypothetical protein